MTNDKPIAKSRIEDDLYKIMMLYAFWRRQKMKAALGEPEDVGEYEFRCRNVPQFYLSRIIPQLREEFQHLCTLQYSIDDIVYLRGLNLFDDAGFFDFLSSFKFDINSLLVEEVKAPKDARDLIIKARGPIHRVMGLEIPSLYFVNELYFRMWEEEEEVVGEQCPKGHVVDAYLEHLRRKCSDLSSVCEDPYTGEVRTLNFADFGLRRRYSAAVQEAGIQFCKQNYGCLNLTGTSNVYLARKYDIKPQGSGTAHEWYQAFQAFHSKNLRDHQKLALAFWLETFPGRPFFPLTDTVTTPVFLRDLDYSTANQLTGFRQDSGNPIVWTKQVHRRLTELGIPVRDKKYIYSNSLTFKDAYDILHEVGMRCDALFGIGTYFTNSLPWKNHVPLNIVMKLVECNGLPVAKISDDPGKIMCNNRSYVDQLHFVMQGGEP